MEVLQLAPVKSALVPRLPVVHRPILELSTLVLLAPALQVSLTPLLPAIMLLVPLLVLPTVKLWVLFPRLFVNFANLDFILIKTACAKDLLSLLAPMKFKAKPNH